MEHKASASQKNDLEQMLVDETAPPRALPLSLLQDITGGFSADQEIGSGGFAVVYKGILGSRAVAVKRLSNAFMHEMEFHREVECLMRVKHKNVVRFLGYCADRQGTMEKYNGKLVMADVHQRLLCFKYISRGSLDKYIVDAHRQWGTCYNIIKGICEGLQYLHENHIVHLDLKPANILLDNNMVPKISDFGLSRCFEENQSRHITKTILGTMGYLAPEFREGGVIARSADLYSLGVIIIEILTGQKGYQTIEEVLESWSDRLEISQRDILCEQIRICYETGLECRDFNPKKRPASAGDIMDRFYEMESIQEYSNITAEAASFTSGVAAIEFKGSNNTHDSRGRIYQKLRQNVIGILEVSILGARDLLPMKVYEGRLTDPYCVLKYGEKWGRTPTLLNTVAPHWNKQFTWDVFDLSTVITIAVFDDCHHLHSHGVQDSTDQRLGKVRIRLATLQTDRVYTHYYPLMALTPLGLKKTGELHLAVRFTCKSWAKMLAMYGKPLPINAEQPAESLQLRREVAVYMLDPGSQISRRRTKTNFYRIAALLSSVIAIRKWFDDTCKWKNPLTTILVHVVFLTMVCYPALILPMVFLCMNMIAAWNYVGRPLHINTPPDNLDAEFYASRPENIDLVLDPVLWYADQVHPDERNEEFDMSSFRSELGMSTEPDEILRLRYDRLRMVAGRLQTVVGDLAMQGERAQLLLSWRDPRATPIFMTLLMVVAIVLYLTPFRVVAMVMGLYFLTPPRIRSWDNPLFNFYSRLPSKDDMMLQSF